MNPARELLFLNADPVWLFAGIAVAIISLASGFLASRGLDPRKRLALFLIRLAALAFVIAVVLRPAEKEDISRAKRPPLAVIVDTSKSMAASAQSSSSLADATRRWLESRKPEFESLSRYYRPVFLRVDDVPREISGPEAVTEPAENEAFSGGSTPLSRSLEAVGKSYPGLAAAILVSDGRDTVNPGGLPPSVAFPVYPVTFAKQKQPDDVWIEAVETPPVAFIRTPVDIQVRVGASGFGGKNVTARVSDADGNVLKAATARLEATGETAITLSFTPNRTGRKAYSVDVTTFPGEASAANNRAQFGLNVVRDKTRVLLVAGSPTWDVKFLRRRLAQDPGIDLITFLILRTPMDITLVPQNEMSLIPFPTKELFSEELPTFDVVIFDDFNFAPYVPAQYLENIAAFVKNSGGGFAMIGGERSFAGGNYGNTPLAGILPLTISAPAPGARPFEAADVHASLTSSGAAHPVFQWIPDKLENRMFFESLPGMTGMNRSVAARPEAVVLAEDTKSGAPLAAVMEFGSGRSMAVTTDSLWRWTLPYGGSIDGQGGESVYRDFWTRAIRWLVHDPEMEQVKCSVPEGNVRAGAKSRVECRVLDRSYQAVGGAKLNGVLSGSGKPVELKWSEKEAGLYEAAMPMFASAGIGRVSVDVESGGMSVGRDEMEFTVSPESDELMRLGVDRKYLDALASASGGRVFDAEDASILKALEEKGRADTEIIGSRTDEIWPFWRYLIPAIALFSADWWLRRRWR